MNSEQLWDRIFGLEVGTFGWFISMEPKSGKFHYEFCQIVEKKGNRYVLRRWKKINSWKLSITYKFSWCLEKQFVRRGLPLGQGNSF